MNIGRLDRRIVIETPTETQDTDGSYITTWATYATVWAHKKDHAGTEGLEQERDTTTTRTRFKIRYNSGITTKMRINYNSTYYDIETIKELGRTEGMELMCISKY